MSTALASAHLLAVRGLFLVASTSKTTSKSSGSVTFILFLVVIGLAGYFLLLRPQQQKARRQRSTQSEISVGDEVLTIGGIVGTVLDIDTERVTILTGVEPVGARSTGGPRGAGDPGATPTRMVLVRNAIARKIDPVVEPRADGIPEAELDYDDHPGDGSDGDGAGAPGDGDESGREGTDGGAGGGDGP